MVIYTGAICDQVQILEFEKDTVQVVHKVNIDLPTYFDVFYSPILDSGSIFAHTDLHILIYDHLFTIICLNSLTNTYSYAFNKVYIV